MVGHAFMGAVHSQAWRTLNHVFDLPLRVEQTALCGLHPDQAEAAAHRLGWAGHLTDWRELVARDDIDVIDICTPSDSHAEIAVAALAAGKHVLCEKPLANTVDEARTMTAAAERAAARGIRSMCGFTYRRVPALSLLRNLIADGRLGEIRHVRATYLQDWITDPEFPLVWRLRRERAGSGALGDVGAHIVDLAHYLTGSRLTGVTGVTETFVHLRPLPADRDGGSGGLTAEAAATPELGRVTVDDAAVFIGRLESGALATFEATRFATGRKNALRIEVNGSLGSAAFDFERLNELEFLDTAQPAAEQGFRRILVTEPDHPYLAAWWPPGHGLGYEHSFTHQARDLVAAIAEGHDPRPSFAEALQVQLVIDAVERSATNSSSWTAVPEATTETEAEAA
ncbi:Gfo/Idh/MocA family protein [Kitasatospora sp. NE20-6]|uniref:Gfo/Idh/MocA family protein n=1 Tax=Kitasatospora sp. NE20-6 TaxID=2859066 RepID=UPI0038B3E5F2